MTPLVAVRLADADAERVRQSHASAIKEIQSADLASAKIISDVSLPDGVPVAVAHGLGRAPRFVAPSILRGGVTTGLLVEYRSSHPSTGAPVDRTRFILIAAFAFGATITLDLLVA